ncbi:unnamed protein product, partial [Mesorhabditis spiculigera]
MRLLLPILAAALLGLIESARTSYTNYRLVSFTATKTAAEWLHYLEEYGYDYAETEDGLRTIVDVFSEPSKHRREAVVLVAPEFYPTFMDYMVLHGVTDVRLLKEDVQRDIDMAQRYGAKRRVRRTLVSSADFSVDEYHSYGEMEAYMQKLSDEMPHVEMTTIGNSYEGRTLHGIKVSSGGPSKPAILVDAGVHAREWIAPAAALFLIHTLATKYEHNSTIRAAVNRFDWYIVPQINPDGYEYSRTVDRLWRKTRSKNMTINKWCVGADANRNWGYKWGGTGANRSPCSAIYGGSAPYSEPEIRAFKDFIDARINRLTIYISLHSYGQHFLSPWGYTEQRPVNYEDQKNAADMAIAAIKNATGAYYNHGTISELMYPASGTSIDLMQSRGVPYIYGVELRPTDTVNSFGFSIPQSYIRSTGEEMMAALLALAEYATIQQKL